MTLDELEHIEQTTFEMVVQALTDYRQEAVKIFREERDDVKDIAEDVMRESIETMGLSSLHGRLYGKVDYKKAIYAFVPRPQPVALMLDAKAEKGNGSATIQMSQTSMKVRFYSNNGNIISGDGALQETISQDGRVLRVVSIVAKYAYADRADGGYDLENIIAVCIPSGALQDRYNPTYTDHIWRVGRNAPTLGEDFRVRVRFDLLKEKADWRVRYI